MGKKPLLDSQRSAFGRVGIATYLVKTLSKLVLPARHLISHTVHVACTRSGQDIPQAPSPSSTSLRWTVLRPPQIPIVPVVFDPEIGSCLHRRRGWLGLASYFYRDPDKDSIRRLLLRLFDTI